MMHFLCILLAVLEMELSEERFDSILRLAFDVWKERFYNEFQDLNKKG